MKFFGGLMHSDYISGAGSALFFFQNISHTYERVGMDNSDGIATRYGLDGWGSNPCGGDIFRTHPASYKMGTGPFPGVKRPRRGVNHPLPI